MVKQFTIPCQFGQEMSPVTLYIGHPEATHHPINFQSNWLSSAKGGTIPQDLMDTLQKLHDLAEENGADFEELCYYALISATQHGTGNGVSQDDINKYADEFVKTEGQCAQGTQQQNQSNNQSENNSNSSNNSNTTSSAQTNNGNNNLNNEPQENKDDETLKDVIQNTYSKEDEDKVEGMFSKLGEMFSKKNNNNDNTKTSPTINMSSTQNNSTSTKNSTNSSNAVAVYTAEDEDLLLMDDLEPILDDNNEKNSNIKDMSNNGNNNTNNIKEAEPIDNSNGTYSDDDADLL